MLWICLFLCFVPVNLQYVNSSLSADNLSSPCTDRNHLFLTPGVLSAGTSNRACLSRFYAEGPAVFRITVLTEDQQTSTAVRELVPGDGGCLDVVVGNLPNTRAGVTATVSYPEAHCTWSSQVRVHIASGSLAVIHPERARYRPGETVRLRIYGLKGDLTPQVHDIEEVWLEGPSGAWAGARVAQWLAVRTRMGLAQLQHTLDDAAPPGTWSVKARLADGSQGSATFQVGNYEVPPFQLSVRHPLRVLRTSERLVWTVCVRYPWTEAVEGILVIRLRAVTMLGSCSGVRTAVRIRAPRACHRHAVAARRVGLGSASCFPHIIAADFSFQEDGTRIWQNTTVVSQVVDKPVTLEFVTKRPVIFIGLPYKLKVKAQRWDEKPSVGEQIRVCRSFTDPEIITTSVSEADKFCVLADTDASGVATVVFPAESPAPAYWFEAQLTNGSSRATVRAVRGAAAAFGPLHAAPAPRTFVPLYLSLRNVSTPLTVHFVVITRGGTIYRWGATTQCPVARTNLSIQSTPRNGRCDHSLSRSDLIQRDETENKTETINQLLDRYFLKVMLPIKVTQQMCPDSHLIAYFYHDGEFISANKHFEMDDCFANKVEANFVSRQILPGSTATLQISTPGPALCALTALDASAKWTQPTSVKDVLLKELKRLMENHRNLTEYDAAGDCFFYSDEPVLPTNSHELASVWLASAGIRVSGGDRSHTRQCDGSPAPLVDAPAPRTDFSEAWLWRLVQVGTNGSAVASAKAPDSISRFEANAVCLTRNGIGVSSPAVLQVFREFFIHADSAARLRRGDTAIVRYRIFNYLYEPISVQIQILTDPYLTASSDEPEIACIAARSSVARRAEIVARLPGPARFSIRAKTVNDTVCSKTARRELSDEVILKITVDPEGVPVQEHKSILLCAEGNTDSVRSAVSWQWAPVSTVPGTEGLSVWVAGDATGPLLADADALVTLPRGCGEQNMARLATNLLALRHLHPRTAAAIAAREHVARGFTRQLQYLHPSGGFSAFGASDQTSSTWLTAFSVRYMRRTHRVLWPNLPLSPAIERAERWLLAQQMENGCFRNEGHVFHRELRGGLNEEGEVASVALAAYVITSLMESSSPLPPSVIKHTLFCLRALPTLKTLTPTRVYAQTLLAYTFTKLKRYEEDLRKTNAVAKIAGLKDNDGLREVMDLIKMAKRHEDYMWWETSTLSSSIEATGYALLALGESPQALREYGAGAVLWLASHRGPLGGFVSTQDTLVALEALSAWSLAQPAAPANLTVTARGSTLKVAHLQPGGKVPEILDMGSGNRVDVNVHGTGCALVQATRRYHTLATPAQSSQLAVQVQVTTEGTLDCKNNSCFCAAEVEACVVWGGRFPEMALLEVALPGGYGADAAPLYAQLHKPHSLLRRIELSANNGRATLYLAGGGTAPSRGYACFSLHAVGPRTRTRPAYARVFDYYTPTVNHTQIYTIPEECPARIVPESNDYNSTDNLFNRARSLFGSSEIIINHQFSIDDSNMPDGIPIDDFYVYDNLTKQKNKSKSSNKEKSDTQVNTRTNKTEETLTKQNNIATEKHHKSQTNDDKLNEKSVYNTHQLFTEKNQSHNGAENKNWHDQTADDSATIIHLEDNFTHIKNINTMPTERDIVTNPDADNTANSGTDIVTVNAGRDPDNEVTAGNNTGPITVHKIDNPNLADFHVIDTEKDLEVPSGMEGPVPAFVLPPPSYKQLPPPGFLERYFAEMPRPQQILLPPTQSNPFETLPPRLPAPKTPLPQVSIAIPPYSGVSPVWRSYPNVNYVKIPKEDLQYFRRHPSRA